MVSVEDRSKRLLESAQKIQSPFVLDESLCLYSPQDNVDSLQHPRIVEWMKFVEYEYEPRLPKGTRNILLFMPCTKTKPYPFSSEHKAINQRLLDEGFKPSGRIYLPQELQARLEPPFSQEVLNLSPLVNGAGTVVHRMVISEPLGVVPYEHIAEFRGKQSPAVSYDDPGLFEGRGNAVSPWRSDCTAKRCSATRWEWGREERRHYVLMHNAMAETVAKVVARIDHHYDDIIAWVAPGLTHRSFVLARDERSANNVPATRQVGSKKMELVGANDHLPGKPICSLPTREQCRVALERLAGRLNVSVAKANGIYARGGVGATPLALPELLDALVERIGRVSAEEVTEKAWNARL
ncbi:hypothetical protein [Bradyrhizobium prioriisuperbiae]|uniref:hypothetical protein n=1 Tax=Bradyrhizobium prioriisuperbiae TaxID=2854389 RepID=UPI0028E8DC0E|nr:hypothetical protein [Bradyrhizobium prioritasuperba]